ncbi:MAG: quinone-dependent dihydroorotate dehydrogenase [Rickettsiales bacterium]|nr:quinone-dependent dihydroorotate dehydrogenase [Rickettsiales bacterium]
MRIYKIFRPLIFLLPAEKAHNLAIVFLKFLPHTVSLFSYPKKYDSLKTKIFDIEFDNPIGLAAGFDKNAEVFNSLKSFGFGFVETGTVTPKPQSGNPKPRMFRLKEDKGVINRLGFNNLGADNFEKNINAKKSSELVVGINIGKNKDTQDDLEDYLILLKRFYSKASYITINISSPNTKNLRNIQHKENLDNFLAKIISLKEEMKENKYTPILLKIAPDLDIKEIKDIAEVVLANKIDGVIISNTTVDRNLKLKSKNKSEAGGLSGKPLFEKSNEVLKNFYQYTNKQVPIIAVGGISNASDVYEKIKNGASLVQIYSSFIYEGFSLVEKIKKDLNDMLLKDGYKTISQAVGTNIK